MTSIQCYSVEQNTITTTNTFMEVTKSVMLWYSRLKHADSFIEFRQRTIESSWKMESNDMLFSDSDAFEHEPLQWSMI